MHRRISELQSSRLQSVLQIRSIRGGFNSVSIFKKCVRLFPRCSDVCCGRSCGRCSSGKQDTGLIDGCVGQEPERLQLNLFTRPVISAIPFRACEAESGNTTITSWARYGWPEKPPCETQEVSSRFYEQAYLGGLEKGITCRTRSFPVAAGKYDSYPDKGRHRDCPGRPAMHRKG